MKLKTLILEPLFAVSLLAGIYFYMSGNLFAALIPMVLLAYLYRRNRLPEYEMNKKDTDFIYSVMIVVSVVSVLLRFYRITSYPYDFYSDEWSGIIDAYFKMKGDNSFFYYFKRSGAALPYVPNALYIAFLSIFKNHIEFMRLIPMAIFVVTVLELYFLGNRLRDKKMGVVLAFLYSVSGWTAFTSRILIDYIYLPFFVVTFLLFFFLYLEKKQPKMLFISFTVFFAGFFTHAAWLLMIPFTVYLLYEYKEDFDGKMVWITSGLTAVLILAIGVVFLVNKGPLSWASGMTVLGRGNYIIDMILNVRHLPEFFMLPVKSTYWFTGKLAVLNYAEFLLLAGGLIICIVNLKNRLNRILLAGFCISLITLFISRDIDHHSRHIMIQPFITIVSGLCLSELIRWRYSVFLLVLMPLLFINTFFYMFIDWNNSLGTSDKNIKIAKYINEIYKNTKYMFMYGTKPHGEYEVFLHCDAAFERSDKKTEKVLFITTSLLRYRIKDVFPDIKMKYFYDYSGGSKLPLVLCELDISNNTVLEEYFLAMNKQLNQVELKIWNLDYAGVIQFAEYYCEKTENNALAILKNTFLRYTQIKAFEVLDRGGDIVNVLLNAEKPMFLTSDWCLKLGEAYYARGDTENALIFVKEAVRFAPEWHVARQAAEVLRLQGVK